MKIIGRKTVKGEKTSAPKAVKAGAGKAEPSAKQMPTHEEIARRSYELYLERGAQDGHAEDDWARAEAELLGS